jgi:hypothetical protein
MQNSAIEKLHKVPDIYRDLGYGSPQGLYRDIREGNWTAFVRIGAKIRIPESAVRRWVQEQIKQNEERSIAVDVAA